MKIAYIAHPISGNVVDNVQRVFDIVKKINLEEPEVVPFAPYIVDLHALDDDVPAERERGIKNDIELLSRGFVDEIRLYGNTISNGMRQEVLLAHKLGIKIVPMTKDTKRELTFINLK